MPALSHHAYFSFLVNALKEACDKDPDVFVRLRQHKDEVLAVASLDLEPARSILREGYSNRVGGKQPYDCVAMLRSLVIMLFWGHVSFNRWAALLAGQTELRILSGFQDNECPAASTFYDFANRLLDGPYQKRCDHVHPPSERLLGTHGRFSRNLGEEKATRKALSDSLLAEQNEKKVEYLVRQALSKEQQPLPLDFQRRIEEILIKCAVVPSIELGLLEDLLKLTVSGDCTAFCSHANGNGTSTCDCRKNGVYSCDCARTYSDLDATWGWDSYRELYYFGYRLHLLATKNGAYELPLHIMIAPAHNADVVLGVEAVTRFYQLIRTACNNVRVQNWLFDKGYDAEAFYKLLHEFGGRPVIPLRDMSSVVVDNKNIERDKQGHPLCPGRVAMRQHCVDKKTGTISYCCPAKYLGRTNGKPEYKVDMNRCPLAALCEPTSTLGPYIHVRTQDNPRLNTEVVRGSQEWEELYKQRTCPERIFSQMEAVGLKDGAYRRQHLFALSSLAFCLGIHAKAWGKHRQEQSNQTNHDLFGTLEAMLAEKAEKQMT